MHQLPGGSSLLDTYRVQKISLGHPGVREMPNFKTLMLTRPAIRVLPKVHDF